MIYFNSPSKTPYSYGYSGISSASSSDFVSGTYYKSGSEDPNWKVYVSKGLNAGHAYVLSTLPEVSIGKYVCKDSFKDFYNVWRPATKGQGSFGVDGTKFLVPDIAQVTDRALTDVKNKLSDETEFKAIAPLVELREFRGEIKNISRITTDLLQEVIAIKHGRGSAKRIKNLAADSWLTYRFGISPMMKDARDAAEAVARHMLKQHKPNLRMSSDEHFSGTYSRTPINFLGSKYIRYTGKPQHYYEGKVSFVSGISVGGLKSGNDYSIASSFGLGIDDVIPALYELLPYSWLLDYFTNIGDYVSDTFSSSPGTSIYAVKSVLINEQIFCSFSPSLYPIGYTDIRIDYATSFGSSFSQSSFSREMYANLPHISPHFKSHDQVAANGVGKVLNLLALLAK